MVNTLRDIILALISVIFSWDLYCTWRVQRCILGKSEAITHTDMSNMLYSRDNLTDDQKKQLPFLFALLTVMLLSVWLKYVTCFTISTAIISFVLSIIVTKNNDKIALRLHNENCGWPIKGG